MGKSLRIIKIIRILIGVLIFSVAIYHFFIEEIQLSSLAVFILVMVVLLINVSEKIIIDKAKEIKDE